ncbi:MAG: TM2 domain-containing protein, partial [Nitrosomonas sp.]|nr:TM2 domain-containing protein [Nitrosomonas sp.]
LSVFLAGLIMLFTPLFVLGILLILAISVVELFALLKSQVIVQAYNNAVMNRIYQEVVRDCKP